MARRRAEWAVLVPGLLVDGAEARLELVIGEEGKGKPKDCVPLTAYVRPGGQTYFNFRPPERLKSIIAPMIEGYNPRNPVGLHRAVAAVDGHYIKLNERVHHDDHNHLDNTSANLVVWDADEHEAYHRIPGNERIPDGKLPFSVDGLFLRVTFPEPRLTPPGVYEGGGEAEGPPGAAAPVNVDQLFDAGVSGFEQPVDNTGDPFGLPEHRRRTWKSRELQRLGLARQVANAAGWALRAARKLGSNARAGQIVRLVTAKVASERTAYRALDWLVSEGFIEKHDSRFYRLTEAAWTVEETRRRMKQS